MNVEHLVGREQELSRIGELLGAEPPPRAVVLAGEPGVGKTTLWRAGIDVGRELGLRVLDAWPTGAEAQLSFAALIDLLDEVDPAELEGLPDPQRRALDVALLRAEPAGGVPERRAIAVGFLNAVRRLTAGGRLLVAIDDVQWLDAASLEVLSFAGRRLRDERVSFLLSRRSGGRPALERALELQGLERLDVSPLSLGAIRRVLSDRLGVSLPRHLLRRVFELSGGNPLMALELGRAVAELELAELGRELPVPQEVEGLLGTRVATLAAPVRRTLLALSVSGSLRICELAAIVDAATIDEAVGAGLVLVDGDRARPSHPLLAAAASSRALPGERRRLHLELAAVVAERELRARHVALGTERPDSELADAVSEAAAAASARGAAEEAAELAEHALRLTPPASDKRGERLLTLAEYLVVLGRPARVTGLLEPELDRLPPGAERGRAHLLLSEVAVETMAEVEHHLDRALAESDPGSALLATVLARKTENATIATVERILEAESWALDALLPARRAGPRTERLVLYALAWARALRGRPVADLGERFDTISDAAFHIADSVERVAAVRLMWRGEVEEARSELTRLLALSDERGEELSGVLLRQHLWELELRAGQWEPASRLLEEWEEQPDGQLLGGPVAERGRALLAAGRGLPEEAERWAAATIEGSEAAGLRWGALEGMRARGTAALLVHDPARAADSLRTVWEHSQREGVDEPGAFPVARDLVGALLEMREPDAARAAAERLTELSGGQGHPWGRLSAMRAAATVTLAAGPHDEDAAGALRVAAEGYARLGLRFDQARSLLALGRLLRRHRKWAAARRSLEDAAAAFDELGSAGWAEEARSELSRLGARRPRPSGELTPTERRVAELAAEGLANKEIARALFVSVKTVEMHLSHAYAKLGVRSRAQLARRLDG
mgnify:CR=1 FL=1